MIFALQAAAWFVAYTKQVSTAILYVAGDDGNQALDDYKRDGDLTFFGGTYPAMTWVDFMKAAMDLNIQSNAYNAALQASAKIIQPSLMDFLR